MGVASDDIYAEQRHQAARDVAVIATGIFGRDPCYPPVLRQR